MARVRLKRGRRQDGGLKLVFCANNSKCCPDNMWRQQQAISNRQALVACGPFRADGPHMQPTCHCSGTLSWLGSQPNSTSGELPPKSWVLMR